MALLYSNGMNIKTFSQLLNQKGYKEYNYSNVRKKLRGDSDLNWDDIIVFSEVMNVSVNIFFDTQFTKCIPEKEKSNQNNY